MIGRNLISTLASLLLGSAVLVLPATAYAVNDCPVMSPETALAYLKQSHSTLNRNCIDHAINEIRYSDYKPGIDVLFRYLDFTPFAPGVAPMADASQPTGKVYPAADALLSFGKSVLPRVKEVIRDDNETPLSRVNAARIYFGLDLGPEAVRFIVKAAYDAGNSDAKIKLLDFAVVAARYCSDEQKTACQDATR